MTRHESVDAAPAGQLTLGSGAETEREIAAFIAGAVDRADADGVIVNLSGGIDSTVAATLASEALGSERVYGLVLPAASNTARNIEDAHRVAENLGIDYRVIDVQPLVDRILEVLTSETRTVKPDPLSATTRTTRAPIKPRGNYREAAGNVAARLRMLMAYFEANTTSRLVLGTGNRTELVLGYFTKYGDGGVDLLPIGDLYKTEVRDLARHLDVPDDIVEKPPTAGLWTGQDDESELGAPYDVVDPVLRLLVDEGKTVAETAADLELAPDFVEGFAEMVAASRHKRTAPPTPATYPPGADVEGAGSPEEES